MAVPSDPLNTKPQRTKLIVGVALAAAVLAVLAVGLLVNVFERKQEGKNPLYRVVELNDEIDDPAVWGKNFPLHYDGYRRTVDQVRTRFGGSEALPKTPTNRDPRSVVAQSKIEEDTRLKIMWAGYAFAKDFREERGHAFMLEDQTYTARQVVVKQPGTCMQCHASIVIPYRKLGDGDPVKGFEKMNKIAKLMRYAARIENKKQDRTFERKITHCRRRRRKSTCRKTKGLG